jgi:hypothetical protein
MIDDDDFVLDAEGNRVLIGLTLEETLEFDFLEKQIGEEFPFPCISRDEWHSPEEKRWLELWDKHRAAKVLFEQSNKTQH